MKILHYIKMTDGVDHLICTQCGTPIGEIGGSFTTDLHDWFSPPDDYQRCIFDPRISKPVKHGR